MYRAATHQHRAECRGYEGEAESSARRARARVARRCEMKRACPHHIHLNTRCALRMLVRACVLAAFSVSAVRCSRIRRLLAFGTRLAGGCVFRTDSKILSTLHVCRVCCVRVRAPCWLRGWAMAAAHTTATGQSRACGGNEKIRGKCLGLKRVRRAKEIRRKQQRKIVDTV
jgi:hypothetical protein